MNTYGIPTPTPSPDLVDSHLAINNQNLVNVATQLPARVDDALTTNDGELSRVAGTMVRSVDGRLSAASKALAPVVSALQSHVDATLASNDAILSTLPDSVKVSAATAITPAIASGDPPATSDAFTLPGTYTVIWNTQTQTAGIYPSEQLPPSQQGDSTVGVFATYSEASAEWMNAFPGIPVPLAGTGTSVAAAPATPPPASSGGVQSGGSAGGVIFDPSNGIVNRQVNCPVSVDVWAANNGNYIIITLTGTPKPANAGQQIHSNSDYQTISPLLTNLASGQGLPTCSSSGSVPIAPYPLPGQPQPPEQQPQPQQPTPQNCPPCNTPPVPVQQEPTPIQAITGEFNCTQGDFCTRMYSLRLLLIKLGTDLLDNNGLMVDTKFWDAVAQAWSWDNTETDTIRERIDNLVSRVRAQNLSPLYNQILAACLGSGVTEITALEALKIALKWIQSLSTNSSFSANRQGGWNISSSGTSGVGVGKVLSEVLTFGVLDISLGGQTTASVSDTGTWAYATSSSLDINYFVVPLIALIDWFQSWSVATVPIGPEQAAELYVHGFIDEDKLKCYVKMAGLDYDAYKPVVADMYYRPTAFSTERLRRIGELTDVEYARLMNWNGASDIRTQQLIQTEYEQYPTPGDIIRFMVRDVFDESVVLSGAYDTDFDAKVAGSAGRLMTIAGTNKDIAKLYWRAHWQLPSVSQTYEMLHRLRPGRVDPAIQFTTADAVELLKVNDNAPGYINKLIAVSYNPLPIRALRTLYDTNQMDTREVGERYQDMGYSAADAALFANQEETLKKRRVASQTRGWTPTNIARAFSIGSISGERATTLLVRLGYSAADAAEMQDAQSTLAVAKTLEGAQRKVASKALAGTLKAYEVGVVDQTTAIAALVQQGIPQTVAPGLVAAVDLAVQTGLARKAVNAVRTAFRSGKLSSDQAAQQLQSLGIASARMQSYISSWVIGLSSQRRQITGQQVLKLVRDGILTADQARERLSNLGFPNADSEVLLAEVAYQIDASQVRAKAALDKQRARAATKLMTENLRAQKLAERTAEQLCRKTPPSVLIRWFAKELINVDYFERSLVCQGYTPSQIAGFLSDANDKLAAAKAKGKTPENPPTPLPYDQ